MNRELLPCGEDCKNCPHPDCIYEEEERQPAKHKTPGKQRVRSRAWSGGELSAASLSVLHRLWTQRDQARMELPEYKAEHGDEMAITAQLLQKARRARNLEIQRRYHQRSKQKKGDEDHGTAQHWRQGESTVCLQPEGAVAPAASQFGSGGTEDRLRPLWGK